MAGIILNRSRQAPAQDTPAFGGIAERFRRAGDLDRAIALCRDGLKKFPNQLSARATLGWSLLDKGEYDQARAELEQVLRRAPDNLAAIRGLAELHDRTELTSSMRDSVSWAADAKAAEEALARESASSAEAESAILAAEAAAAAARDASSPIAAAAVLPEQPTIETVTIEEPVSLVSPAAAAVEAVARDAGGAAGTPPAVPEVMERPTDLVSVAELAAEAAGPEPAANAASLEVGPVALVSAQAHALFDDAESDGVTAMTPAGEPAQVAPVETLSAAAAMVGTLDEPAVSIDFDRVETVTPAEVAVTAEPDIPLFAAALTPTKPEPEPEVDVAFEAGNADEFLAAAAALLDAGDLVSDESLVLRASDDASFDSLDAPPDPSEAPSTDDRGHAPFEAPFDVTTVFSFDPAVEVASEPAAVIEFSVESPEPMAPLTEALTVDAADAPPAELATVAATSEDPVAEVVAPEVEGPAAELDVDQTLSSAPGWLKRWLPRRESPLATPLAAVDPVQVQPAAETAPAAEASAVPTPHAEQPEAFEVVAAGAVPQPEPELKPEAELEAVAEPEPEPESEPEPEPVAEQVVQPIAAFQALDEPLLELVADLEPLLDAAPTAMLPTPVTGMLELIDEPVPVWAAPDQATPMRVSDEAVLELLDAVPDAQDLVAPARGRVHSIARLERFLRQVQARRVQLAHESVA
jgi:hypothetical protein